MLHGEGRKAGVMAMGPDVRYYTTVAECLEEHLSEESGLHERQITVLQADLEATAESLQATVEQCKQESKSERLRECLGSVNVNSVHPDQLFWGTVDMFAGLERAVVVLLRHVSDSAHLNLSELEDQARGMLYSIVTRCLYATHYACTRVCSLGG